MVKIDLKVAYYAAPIHQTSYDQSLLSFLWDNKPFQFTCLATIRSLLYTENLYRSVEAGSSVPQREGHQINYLYRRYSHNGDGLIKADGSRQSISDTQYSGNPRFPSELSEMHSPTHSNNFMNLKHYLSLEKVTTVTKEATTLLISHHQVSARLLEKMIGLLSATIPVVLPAPPACLHYRHLQQMKNHLVSSGGYKNFGPLTKEAQFELKWWLQTLHRVNRGAIKPNLPDIMISMGASTWGWRARSGETTIGGTWNNTEMPFISAVWSYWGRGMPHKLSYRKERISQFFCG